MKANTVIRSRGQIKTWIGGGGRGVRNMNQKKFLNRAEREIEKT